MDDRHMAGIDIAGEVRDLRVAFGGREVLRGVELAIPARGITVILGRSGSGKTTFLRSLNRLNECFTSCRTQGSVRLRLDGEWINVYGHDGLNDTDLRRRVGMVFQTPNVLPVSIERNMSLPLRLTAGLSRSEVRDRTEYALREALLWDEVSDRLREPAANLSGGQQQRLCLARTLALKPEILLLDEPTSSLDFVAAAKVEELLLALKARYSLVMVSHSLGQARRLSDQAAVLHEGAVARIIGRGELMVKGVLEECIEELL
jgi:phosphate transport system ATP-binding protein